MGSPQQPTTEQYAELEKAGQLAVLGSPQPVKIVDGKLTIALRLPRQGVSLLLLKGN
jgi:xylan 1,4-beta-xylosidase